MFIVGLGIGLRGIRLRHAGSLVAAAQCHRLPQRGRVIGRHENGLLHPDQRASPFESRRFLRMPASRPFASGHVDWQGLPTARDVPVWVVSARLFARLCIAMGSLIVRAMPLIDESLA